MLTSSDGRNHGVPTLGIESTSRRRFTGSSSRGTMTRVSGCASPACLRQRFRELARGSFADIQRVANKTFAYLGRSPIFEYTVLLRVVVQPTPGTLKPSLRLSNTLAGTPIARLRRVALAYQLHCPRVPTGPGRVGSDPSAGGTGRVPRGRTEIFDFRDDERRSLSNHLTPRRFTSATASTSARTTGRCTTAPTRSRERLTSCGESRGFRLEVR